MTNDKNIELSKKLDILRRNHRDLEEQITLFSKQKNHDEFTVVRFKKEKLSLRDQILTIENQLYPDIIA